MLGHSFDYNGNESSPYVGSWGHLITICNCNWNLPDELKSCTASCQSSSSPFGGVRKAAISPPWTELTVVPKGWTICRALGLCWARPAGLLAVGAWQRGVSTPRSQTVTMQERTVCGRQSTGCNIQPQEILPQTLSSPSSCSQPKTSSK